MDRAASRPDVRHHRIVSHDEWTKARKELLAREKAFTRERDALSQARRDLPWEKIGKRYVFDTHAGERTLADLFGGRSQLLVYHFMFAPDWKEGCPHCSFWADNFDGIVVHLAQRDVTMLAISRAPLEKIDAFKRRMGWSFDWVSSGRSDFNYDLGASFTDDEVEGKAPIYNYATLVPGTTDREGVSVFYQDADGAIFHTYSTYARGIDLVNTAYNYLDLVPKGRDEDEFPGWVRHHDRY
jgi:predicted dithiol-disulfide oxidoreductase (DUF899 family)